MTSLARMRHWKSTIIQTIFSFLSLIKEIFITIHFFTMKNMSVKLVKSVNNSGINI